MKTARFLELNLQVCIPPGWSVVPEKAAVAQQQKNYGVIRGLRNSRNDFSAFLFSLYGPNNGLLPCLVPGTAINCATHALVSGKLITGNERLINFDDWNPGHSFDKQGLVYRTWTTPDGGVHVIVTKADAGPPEELWNMLESAEVIYDENEMAAAQK